MRAMRAIFGRLSARLLALTLVFIFIAECLIFLPSVARFRLEYLQNRLERAQIASLALLATMDDQIIPDLELELLETAQVINVVFRRNASRELILSQALSAPVAQSYDLRDASGMTLIGDALFAMFVAQEPRIIRVIGEPVQDAGLVIEITLDEAGLREEMRAYGLRVFFLSAWISGLTALALFFGLRVLVVRPMKRLIGEIRRYQDAPQDAGHLIEPRARVVEFREIEAALLAMQQEVRHSLRQKERLAHLGSAVSKISHDLRNTLTTMQLLAERLEDSEEPAVRLIVPRLERAMMRATAMCETTLSYGRLREDPPQPERFALRPMLEELIEEMRLLHEPHQTIIYDLDFAPGLFLFADPAQMRRVFENLLRNAIDALGGVPDARITLQAEKQARELEIRIMDNGAGVPEALRARLFEPYITRKTTSMSQPDQESRLVESPKGTSFAKGTGLGLVIVRELVEGHGGRITLDDSGSESGSCFCIRLPARPQP